MAGVLSACFAFGLAGGKPIAREAVKLGTDPVYANNAVLAVILIGGFISNFAWCLALNFKNKSLGDYVTGKPGSQLAGVLPDWHGRLAEASIAPYLRGEPTDAAEPTAYWLTYVYLAAEKLGLEREALAHLRTHWSPMLEAGGCWERFDDHVGRMSASHAWSAHPIYHLPQLVTGVSPTEPAWRRIRFKPMLDHTGISRSSCRVPTPHGTINARWTRAEREAEVELNLPPGIEADVELPGTERFTAAPGQHTWTVPIAALLLRLRL